MNKQLFINYLQALAKEFDLILREDHSHYYFCIPENPFLGYYLPVQFYNNSIVIFKDLNPKGRIEMLFTNKKYEGENNYVTFEDIDRVLRQKLIGHK